jgi:hypothetical protein
VTARLGGPRLAQLAAACAPTGVRYALVTARLSRRRRPPEELARLAALDVAGLIADLPRSTRAALVTEALLERKGGRAAIEAAASGTAAERLAAAEAAVWWKAVDRRAGLALAGRVLTTPSAPDDAVARALVAVWDSADAVLLTHLRTLHRSDALIVRARSGDPTALDDWIAGTHEARAADLVLALGKADRGRVQELARRSAEGTPARARANELLEKMSMFAWK